MYPTLCLPLRKKFTKPAPRPNRTMPYTPASLSPTERTSLEDLHRHLTTVKNTAQIIRNDAEAGEADTAMRALLPHLYDALLVLNTALATV